MAASDAAVLESVKRTDSAITLLQAAIAAQSIKIGNGEVQAPRAPEFAFDDYFAFVRAWNEYKSSVRWNVSFTWNMVQFLDGIADYYRRNETWREQAENKLGLAKQSVPSLPPTVPTAEERKNATTYPYEGAIKIGAIFGILYLIVRVIRP